MMGELSDKARAFLLDVIEVCKKHSLSLTHEDRHGTFVVCPYDEFYIDLLRDAEDYSEDDA